MKQRKFLKKLMKSLLSVFAALVLAFGSLFLSVSNSQAIAPTMAVHAKVSEVEDTSQGWTHNLTTQNGRTVTFYLEIHNTVVGTQARNVRARVDLSSGTSTSHNIPVTVWADNAAAAGDNVVVNIPNPTSGSKIKYIPGSVRVVWDENGDGVLDYNMTPAGNDDIVTAGGFRIGDQSGCNDFIIQVVMNTYIEGAAQPQPTPTPSPAATGGSTNTNVNLNANSSSSTGGSVNNSGNSGSSSSSSTSNSSVTINNPASTVVVPAVAAAKAPLKTPDTGVGILGMASMFGAAPFGVMLSRYGRGRLIGNKREEELTEVAARLVSKRSKRVSA